MLGISFLGVAIALVTTGASSQPVEHVLQGVVVEKVVCREDPTQSYALYLPSRYTPEKPWPILYCLDPRGRALTPIERFREAAERYGYILASTYNTRGDGPIEPSIQAVRTLWRDTHQRFAIDVERTYIAGFSGSARVASLMADIAPGSVAGVIACGAGFSPTNPPRKDLPFAFFGAAGNTDFNHDEVIGLDPILDELEVVHRIEVFEGAHEWMPASLSTEAVEWMEIQAMKEGGRSRDETLIDALLKKGLERAKRWEAVGRVYEAYYRYQTVARDFAGLREVSEAERAAARLSESKELEAFLKKREELVRRDAEYIEKAPQHISRVSPGDRAGFRKALAQLRISELKKEAQQTEDREEALSAQRLLETLFIQTSFYLPRELFEKGDYERARLILSIASEVKPDNPVVWFNLARAQAGDKRKREAIRSLERAVELGFTDLDLLKEHADFESLRKEKDFLRLMEELEK